MKTKLLKKLRKEAEHKYRVLQVGKSSNFIIEECVYQCLDFHIWHEVYYTGNPITCCSKLRNTYIRKRLNDLASKQIIF